MKTSIAELLVNDRLSVVATRCLISRDDIEIHRKYTKYYVLNENQIREINRFIISEENNKKFKCNKIIQYIESVTSVDEGSFIIEDGEEDMGDEEEVILEEDNNDIVKLSIDMFKSDFKFLRGKR